MDGCDVELGGGLHGVIPRLHKMLRDAYLALARAWGDALLIAKKLNISLFLWPRILSDLAPPEIPSETAHE